MTNALLTALIVLASTASALAAPDERALGAYNDGRYEAAADIAAITGGAENFALAARALNAAAYLEPDDDRAIMLAKRAADLADAAVEADPDNVEGHLQGAIALAQRGARISGMRAFFLGLAGRARDRLDRALKLAPENPWALSTSAGWHLGVAARAGDGRFGSDAAKGYEQFLAARWRDPMNISIAYEMALRVLAFGEAAWREEALRALETARTAPAANAFDMALKARADAFAAAIAESEEAEQAFIDAQP